MIVFVRQYFPFNGRSALCKKKIKKWKKQKKQTKKKFQVINFNLKKKISQKTNNLKANPILMASKGKVIPQEQEEEEEEEEELNLDQQGGVPFFLKITQAMFSQAQPRK